MLLDLLKSLHSGAIFAADAIGLRFFNLIAEGTLEQAFFNEAVNIVPTFLERLSNGLMLASPTIKRGLGDLQLLTNFLINQAGPSHPADERWMQFFIKF